ncbi:hypothetical protein [Marinobacterium aestuariivivens]|uniref:Response regulatory domain-containing protein n=1 Tax=Marinobacterium aestuariivivens TaxID=1698799 RepID=A0ABW1ZUL4_9GAMM
MSTASRACLPCRILFCDPRASHRAIAYEAGAHEGWDLLNLDDETQVLSQLRQFGCHVLIVVAQQQPYRALELLQRVMEEKPGVVRILVSGYMTPASSARALEVAHRILPDTVNGAELVAAIEYALKIEALVHKSAIRDYVSGLGRLPTLPTAYRALNEALNSDVSDARISPASSNRIRPLPPS